MKLILTAPMHGRHATVREAYLQNVKAGINDFVYCATDKADRVFVESQMHRAKVCMSRNNNITDKAQHALTFARQPCDAVMLMGSDNFIDRLAYLRIEALLKDHDYIAFDDIIFHSGGQKWLWPGYPEAHHRHGEPAGAGKIIRADLLGRINWTVWSMYDRAEDRSVDQPVHSRLMAVAKNPARISCERDGVQLVDIKDGQSKTPLRKFNYLKRIG